MHETGDAITLRKLAPFLAGARAGSRKLDMIIAYVLAGMSEETRRRVDLMLEGQFSWDVVSDLFPDEAPRYTTSLDAAVPGENVVFAMHEAERHRWVAIHRTAGGEEIVARGASEALARRGAGLKALADAAQPAPDAEVPAPDATADPQAETSPEPSAEPEVMPPDDRAAELVGGVVTEIAVEPAPVEAPDEPVVATGGQDAGEDAPEPDDAWQIRF